MHANYADIRERIAEPPKWFDERAVPRYCEFQPHQVADIYAREVVLAEIACQGCGAKFHVAFSRDPARYHLLGLEPRELAADIRERTLHYGDPPNTVCCPAGPTMNSEPIRVLEYWRKDYAISFAWVRDTSLETEIGD